MRSHQNGRGVVIKPAGKWSAVVVWDRTDYLKEAERQLNNEKTYQEIRITKKLSWWKKVTSCFLM